MNQVLYLTQNPCIFLTSQVNNDLTDLLFAYGGLAVAVAMDQKYIAYYQIEVIVSDFLLPQEYEMEYIKNCMMVNLSYIMITAVLYFYPAHFDILCRYSTVFVFDPPCKIKQCTLSVYQLIINTTIAIAS